MANIKKQRSIPDGWTEQNIGNFAKAYDGTHMTPNYVDEGVPFYSVEHVTANNFTKTKFVAREVFDKENERVKLEKGDVLMTRIGDIGRAKYIDWDVEASFYVSLALLKIKKGVDSKFVAYAINGLNGQREMWSKSIHVAYPKKINLGDISKCSLKLPSDLKEQQRIVKVLNSWDKAIEKLSQTITLKREVKKGLMQKLLTGELRLTGFKGEWKKYELEELMKPTSEKYDPQTNKDVRKCIELEHLQKEDSKLLGYVSSSEQKSIKNVFYPGNILFGKLRPYLRKFLLSDFSGVCSTEIWVLKTTQKLSNIYAYHLVQTEKFLYIANVSSGTHMPRADWKYMRGISFLIPEDLEEQRAIADILQSIDFEIRLLDKKLGCYEEQKKYLLNNLVTGQMRTPENL